MTTSGDIKTFSQALPILADFGKIPEQIGHGRWRIGTLEYDKRSIIALARELEAQMQTLQQRPLEQQPTVQAIDAAVRGGEMILSAELQDCARRYVAAQQRSGEALLEACKALHEARQLARHGEWGAFLAATRTSEGAAKRLLDIHTQAERDPQFRQAVASNWIGATVAAELAQPSFPAETRSALLAGPEPPTKADVQAAKYATVADLAAPTRPMRDAEIVPPGLPAGWSITSRPGFEPGVNWYRAIGPDNKKTGEHKTADGAAQAARALAHHTAGAPFWQSLSPAHPTAHLWIQERPEYWRAACGIVNTSAPAGSTDGGHCSSCVRATWKGEPAQPEDDRPTDAERDAVKARWAALGYNLQVQGPDRWLLFPPGDRPGIANMTWRQQLERLEIQERKAEGLIVGQRENPNAADPKTPPAATLPPLPPLPADLAYDWTRWQNDDGTIGMATVYGYKLHGSDLAALESEARRVKRELAELRDHEWRVFESADGYTAGHQVFDPIAAPDIPRLALAAWRERMGEADLPDLPDDVIDGLYLKGYDWSGTAWVRGSEVLRDLPLGEMKYLAGVDDIPHLPADFQAAQKRAGAIGLHIAMDMRGLFSITNDGGSGVDHIPEWASLLRHLEHQERAAAEAAAERKPSRTALPIDIQKRLVAAGAGIMSDGMVLPPKSSGEAAAVLDADQAEAALARWSARTPERPEAPEGWTWRENNSLRRIADAAVVGPYARIEDVVSAAALIDRERPAPDVRSQAILLLKQLAPLMSEIKTEDLEGLSMAIDDLNSCEEGTEVRHWLRVGWALLDVVNDDSPAGVPTLESEGIV